MYLLFNKIAQANILYHLQGKILFESLNAKGSANENHNDST
ncbi:hypothetical protein pb186bvf_013386 [Paramecium bursaria]